MKKFIFIISFLFLFSFYFVYQQSKIYILAYEINSYQKKIALLQKQAEALRCQILPYMTLASLDSKVRDLHLSFSALPYVNINADAAHPSRKRSLLAKIFNFSVRAEAKP